MMNGQLRSTLLKAVVPALIGVGVVIWMFVSDFDPLAWSLLHFDARTAVGLLIAIVFVFGRDFGLAWRFRTITAGALSWGRAFRVDIMCAFASAITPSAVGGSALAVFFLNREGINVGRATTLTLTTLLLDEMFFVVFCPIIFLLVPWSEIFGEVTGNPLLTGIEWVFWVVYAGIVIWAAILYIGILARPEWLERVVVRLFERRWLRRFAPAVRDMMSNLRETSDWVHGRSRRWWLQVFGATTVSWFSRYFVVNALFWTFVPAASGLVVFARQFVVWVVLMVSPTPGGSGVSEYIFTNYYGDLIGDVSIALVLATLWRLLSYYLYLIGGAILAPSYFRKHEISDKSDS